MDAFVSMKDLFRVVGRHWLAAGSVFFATLLVVVTVTFTTTPIYESSAVVLVKVGRDFVNTPEVGDRPAIATARDRDAVINAHVQILRSTDLLDSLVATLGQEKLYPELGRPSIQGAPPSPQAVEKFRGAFTVEPIIEASVIRIAFRHPSPQMAANVVKLAVESFKEKQLDAFNDPETTAFLEEKVATYKKKLDESERKIQEFQAQNKPFLDRGEHVLRQREEIAASLTLIGNEIVGLKERLDYLMKEKENTLSEPSSLTRSDPVISKAKADLLALQLEEQRLLAGYRADSRQVVAIRKQIEMVKNFLAEQEAALARSGVSGQLESQIVDTRAQLLSEQAKKAKLEEQLFGVNASLATLPRLDAEYRELARERDTNEKNYETYSRNLEDARISEEMDSRKIANISVIEEASVPSEPILPRKKLNLGIGALVGALLGVGLAFYLEAARPSEQRRVIAMPSASEGAGISARGDSGRNA